MVILGTDAGKREGLSSMAQQVLARQRFKLRPQWFQFFSSLLPPITGTTKKRSLFTLSESQQLPLASLVSCSFDLSPASITPNTFSLYKT
jgi:hypothetical protein